MMLDTDAELFRDQGNRFGGFCQRRCLAASRRRHLAGALVASAMIAAGLTALTQPSDARNKPMFKTTVDRTHKGNRLPEAVPLASSRRNSGSREPSKSNDRPRLGCESAFSPVAEPERADIFGRCAA